MLQCWSTFTSDDAVISSNISPYGLIRKWCSGPGTRAVMWVKIPAAIISGIMTISIAGREVPARSRACGSSQSWKGQLPRLAPKKSARMKELTSSWPKK